MAERYPVDSLSPQYEEIAAICTQGKPVILTRDDQELILLNPHEFKKMIQLASLSQKMTEERDAALSRIDDLQNELIEVRSDLEDARSNSVIIEEEPDTPSRGEDFLPADAFDREYPQADSNAQGAYPAEAEVPEEGTDISEDIETAQEEPVEGAVIPASQDTGLPAPVSDGISSGPAAVNRRDLSWLSIRKAIEDRARLEMAPVPEGLAIETDDLTKKFGNNKANSNVYLHVPYGAVYALIGADGAGKTTLLRSLRGIHFPNSGRIVLCESSGKDLNDVRELTGSIVEKPVFYEDMSVYQNLVYRAKLLRLKSPKPAIRDTLTRLKLYDLRRRKLRTLSTGTRQKVGLAMAILGNPELLILDEPFNELDYSSTALVQELLMEMNSKGTTIMITSNRLEEITPIATHYGLMDHGELIRELSARQVLENNIDLDSGLSQREEV